MNKILHLLLLLVINKSANSVDRIIGGERAAKAQFPYFAQLRFSGQSYNGTCGATLIHPLWLLTAAHCLPNTLKELQELQNRNLLTVYMGTNIRFGLEEDNFNKIAAVVKHPDYVNRQQKNGTQILLNDVAVAKLMRAYNISKYVSVISLPPYSTSRKAEDRRCAVGAIVGIGWTRFDTHRSIYVLYAIVQSLERHEIKSQMPPSESLFFSEIGMWKGHSYRGDSGGPFICYKLFDCQPVQYGIISFIAVDTRRRLIVMAYENIEKFLDFILHQVPDAQVYVKNGSQWERSERNDNIQSYSEASMVISFTFAYLYFTFIAYMF